MVKDTRDSKARVAAHRVRLRAAGLRPIEVWALPEYHAKIREYVAQLPRLEIQAHVADRVARKRQRQPRLAAQVQVGGDDAVDDADGCD